MKKADIENAPFTKFLIKNKNKCFHVVSLQGNNGDKLIHDGLYKKMRELKIKFHVTEIRKNKLFYIQRYLYQKFGISGSISVRSDCDFVLLQGGVI